MSEELKIDIVKIYERIGTLQTSVEKAHTRVDGITADVKKELDVIASDVKLLLANMNQAKGSKAAWLLVGSLGVALIGALVKIFT